VKIIALTSLLREHGMTHHREEKLVRNEVEPLFAACPGERAMDTSSSSGLLFHLEMDLEQDITFSDGSIREVRRKISP
jgi:hypothetical protein